MHVAIDMQGAQGPFRQLGIGRYSRQFVTAIVRTAGRHRVTILKNGAQKRYHSAFEDMEALAAVASRRVWFPAVDPVDGRASNALYEFNQALFEALLLQIRADVIHHTHAFEGFSDSAFVPKSLNLPVAKTFTFYSLQPPDSQRHLNQQDDEGDFNRGQLQAMRQANQLFLMSDVVAHETIEAFKGQFAPQIYSVGYGSDTYAPSATTMYMENTHAPNGRPDFNGLGATILYYGRFDNHGDIDLLIEAFSRTHIARDGRGKLLLAGVPAETVKTIKDLASWMNIGESVEIFQYPVNDILLQSLMAQCTVFVYPSSHEEHGQPIAEAISAGAAVICSDLEPFRKIHARSDARFLPGDASHLTCLIDRYASESVLRDELRRDLQDHRIDSWDDVGRNAWRAWESVS